MASAVASRTSPCLMVCAARCPQINSFASCAASIDNEDSQEYDPPDDIPTGVKVIALVLRSGAKIVSSAAPWTRCFMSGRSGIPARDWGVSELQRAVA
jgi:hypothetical protein